MATITSTSTPTSITMEAIPSDDKYSDLDPQLADAIRRSHAAYDRALKGKDDWAAYQAMKEKVGHLEKIAGPSWAHQETLMYGYNELVSLGAKIRTKKVEQEEMMLVRWVFSPILPIPLCCLACWYCAQTRNLPWVSGEEITRYRDASSNTITRVISDLKKTHGIQKGTDMNTVANDVRERIASAYYQLGYLNSLSESVHPSTCQNVDRDQVVTRDSSAATTNCKLATEWDPESTFYAQAYEKQRANLYRPVVHVTHYG